ncbi:MAG TPA: hypothetical protein VFE98_08330 [Candidatus Bathyarchaeia archaeon]|nr:hypothetical protein [Candidatus Bathyarchaeia archaeon]
MSVIAVLCLWVISEYLNNTYFQSYVNSLAPIVVPILSVAFGVTSATIATFLYFGMKRVQSQEVADAQPRKRLRGRRGRRMHAEHKGEVSRVPSPRFVITSPPKDVTPKNNSEKKDSK